MGLHPESFFVVQAVSLLFVQTFKKIKIAEYNPGGTGSGTHWDTARF
jgi:hypothetical protein